MSAVLVGLVSVAQAQAEQTATGHSAKTSSLNPAQSGEAVAIGDLTISGGFARATLPNQPVGGGFFAVTHSGDADDRLVSVSTEVSPRVEIHEMRVTETVMKMRKLEGGLHIPAGETVVLEPGGLHLMFMDLTQPLIKEEILPVTLTFENAGEVVVPLAIKAPNARKSGDHSTHDGH
ncbi:hypothetical protein C0U40_12205 [Amylibacter cionae]|nr:hypothetical protein C0U40_12205 [Amylibacter cionae]